MMNLKQKVVKTIRQIFCMIFLLCILFILFMFVFHVFKNFKESSMLKELGYSNVVRAKDYSLNVAGYGSDDPKHVVVCMSGLGMSDFDITFRKVTDCFSDDNLIVFVDRVGYGVSDDTIRKVTASSVVENYRAALANAGYEAPYVLAAHSISGAYATYWESVYPEEIEGVAFIDSTPLVDGDVDLTIDSRLEGFFDNMTIAADKIGLHRLSVRKRWGTLTNNYSSEDQKIADALNVHHGMSAAMNSEYHNINDICHAAYNNIKENDIPKIYISASYFHDKQEITEYYKWLRDSGRSVDVPEKLTAKEYNDILEYCERTEKAELLPYLEMLGNCDCVRLPGDHCIYMQKPIECAEIIDGFLQKLPVVERKSSSDTDTDTEVQTETLSDKDYIQAQ